MFFNKKKKKPYSESAAGPDKDIFGKFVRAEQELERDTYGQVKTIVERAALDAAVVALRKWIVQEHPNWWLEGHASEFVFGMAGRGYRQADLGGILLAIIEAETLPNLVEPSHDQIRRAFGVGVRGHRG